MGFRREVHDRLGPELGEGLRDVGFRGHVALLELMPVGVIEICEILLVAGVGEGVEAPHPHGGVGGQQAPQERASDEPG